MAEGAIFVYCGVIFYCTQETFFGSRFRKASAFGTGRPSSPFAIASRSEAWKFAEDRSMPRWTFSGKNAST